MRRLPLLPALSVAVVLGSGWGGAADLLGDARFEFSVLSFPGANDFRHAGQFVRCLGQLGGQTPAVGPQALGDAVGHQLRVVGHLQPGQRDGAVLGPLVRVEQYFALG